MSIDSLIDDKKDALASSGRPLNQGVGPDLIEVLATRKLLEEKAMAARDMALKQQNIPNTIAEQQDQKLLGLTQKEVANQTGGIMQQRAQQQQRPQQRPQQGGIMGARPPMPQGARPPMGGAPKPPMGGAPRPPMPQGARPPMGGAPRPPMGGAPRPPMMASGGIVGYEAGGKVKSAQEAIRALGNTADKNSPAYQTKLQKILDTLATQSSPEEVRAVTKVLVDAGLKTGPAGSPDTSAAGFYGGLFDFSTGLPSSDTPPPAYKSSQRRREERAARTEGRAARTEENMGARRAEKDAEKAQMNQRLAQANAEPDDLRAGLNMLGGAPKPPTADMSGLGVLRPQGGAPQAPMGGAPKPPMGGAPKPPMGGAPQAPMGGAPQGGVTIPKPEGFEVKKDAVSSGMGPAFTQKLNDRMNQNPADVAAKEREAASKRYKKDETVSGLQSLLDRDLAEAKRVANDPMEQYRRDKAGIYAARAGAPGRAYQQRTLEKQGREGELIKRELSNFATKTNTEQQLISKIDAEAGKAAQRASEEITASMNTILNLSVADRESFDRLLQMDGQRLVKEAELTVQNEANISIEKTRKLAAEASNMTAFTNALTAMSAIIALERETLDNELLVSTKTDEEKAKARKELSQKHSVQYTGPMQEIFKKMGLALKISDSGGSDVEMTDEEKAAMAQVQ